MNLRSHIYTMAVAMLTLLTASCNAIMDDMQPCPPPALYVHFRYDYNIQRADMFTDHCGSVTLYVFDKDGKLIRTVTEENSNSRQPLKSHDFSFRLDSLPEGYYNFIALANQKPLAKTLQGAGAKYRRSDMPIGSHMSDLQVILDRQNSVPLAPDTMQLAKYSINADAPMDTLWHAMRSKPLYYPGEDIMHDTLSLVRDTKMLTISLHHLDKPNDLDVNNFEIFIVDNNRWLNFDNSIHKDDNIVYTPFATWNSDYEYPIDKNHYPMAHAVITFNRLMLYDDPDKCALLCIVNKETGKVVAQINLPEYLSRACATPVYIYSPQEYLDREYDYHMDFFLKEGQWEWVDIRISVLSYAKRIQNLKF